MRRVDLRLRDRIVEVMRTALPFFRPSWTWFHGGIDIIPFLLSFTAIDRVQRGDGGQQIDPSNNRSTPVPTGSCSSRDAAEPFGERARACFIVRYYRMNSVSVSTFNSRHF
jgi:hypothetical protein